MKTHARAIAPLLASALAFLALSLSAEPLFPDASQDKQSVLDAVLDSGWSDAITGANVREQGIDVTLHVDPEAGDDGNRATRKKPIRTLAEAMRRAEEANRKGRDVKVLLLPGIYRDTATLNAEDNDALLVIEGSEAGKVIISGSDDWSDTARWEPVENEQGLTLYRTRWDKDWGDYKARINSRSEKRGPKLNGYSLDDGSVLLIWKAVEGADRYRLERRQLLNKAGEKLDEPFATLTTVEGETRYTDRDVEREETWIQVEYEYRAIALAGEQALGTSNTTAVMPGTRSSASRPDILGRRRELVFVDAQLMQPKLAVDELQAGSFCVDEGFLGNPADGWLYLALPEGATLDGRQIDVGRRPEVLGGSLLTINRKQNLIIRNLTFRHATTRVWNAAALAINHGANVLVEDCEFYWNNGRGLNYHYTDKLTVRDCKVLHSGGTGLGGGGGRNILLENLETAYGNWRGKLGNISSWFFGGIKTGFGQRGIKVVNHHTHHNWCHGLWFDYNNKEIYIEGLRSYHNYSNGLFIEASFGPCVVKDSLLAFNGSHGIHHANLPRTAVIDSVLYGNTKAQFDVIDWMGRGVRDSDSGKEYKVNEGYLSWRGNIAVSTDPKSPLVKGPSHPHIIDTFLNEGNLWWHPKPEAAFKISDLHYTLEDWQLMTGQDLNSQFADPRLRDPATLDFKPQQDSIVHTRKDWPKRSIPDAGSHHLDQLRLGAAEQARKQPFPTLQGNEQFQPIDLAPYANRPVTGEDAWIGMDFPQLTEHQMQVHGVPYEIVDQEANEGFALLALRCKRMERSRGKDIAVSTEVAYAGQAQSFFILHGAGYIGEFKELATYEILYEDSSSHAVNIRSVGDGGHDTDIMLYRTSASHLQDWWPSNYQFNSEHVRNVLMINRNDPKALPAYLYNYELQNPHPDKAVRALRFTSLNPEADHCVLICAITAKL